MNKKTLHIVLAVIGVGAVVFYLGRNKGDREVGVGIDTARNSVGSAPSSTSDFTETSNYKNYSEENLAEARSQGKVVLLYFTANWCPTCAAQEPINKKVFGELESDPEIVVLRAHILDSQTTKETEKLAQDYSVRLQHTFVLLDPKGEVVFTYVGTLVGADLKGALLDAKKT